MRNKKMVSWLGAASAVVLLSACGAGPSESDMREALVKQAEATGVRMIASNYKDKIAKAKLVGCAKAEQGGYECDVSNDEGAVMHARFVKTDAGWAVVN